MQRQELSGRLHTVRRDWRQKRGVLEGGAAPELTAYAPLLPAPALKHPVLMVPALAMYAEEFKEIANHFATHPDNGTPGQLGHASTRLVDINTGKRTRAHRLFALDYRVPGSGSTRKLAELTAAVDQIGARTGSRELTFLTHSAGCHDVRLFLQKLGSQYTHRRFHVIAMGQGRYGLTLGDLGARIISTRRYEEASRASRLMHELNEGWDEQLSRVASFTFVGVTGALTLNGNRVVSGDGFVPESDLYAPGANTVVLRTADPTPMAHRNVVRYSGVISTVIELMAKNARSAS